MFFDHITLRRDNFLVYLFLSKKKSEAIKMQSTWEKQQLTSTNKMVDENLIKRLENFKASMEFFFLFIWVFFHEHSRFTRQQGKGEGIYLTPLYHFHPLHRHLDISRAITAESSPLHIAGSRTRTRNLWFPSASR